MYRTYFTYVCKYMIALPLFCSPTSDRLGLCGEVTGDTGPIATKLTTEPAEIKIGESFSLTLSGVGFPLDDALKNNLGARQRIKIIACARAPENPRGGGVRDSDFVFP